MASSSFASLSFPALSFQHLLSDQTFRDRWKRSITIADKSLLRGTSPTCFLSQCGRRLSGTSGGIGLAAGAENDEYNESFEVSELDVFLSHSWHAPWHLKYLVLLFYFNGMPAVAASCLTSLIYWGSVMTGLFADSPRDIVIGPSCIGLDLDVVAMPLGMAVFVVVLLSWHHVSKLGARFQTSVFLDKVCIHQHDMARKEAGIKAIGGFVKNSKMMLVAWDQTYFSRLWCTFELASFCFAQPDRPIVLAPVHVGGFSLAMITMHVVKFVIFYGFILFYYRYEESAPHRVEQLFQLLDLPWRLVWYDVPPLLICVRMLRAFFLARAQLNEQLSKFSVQASKCFCCSVGHRLPETGAQLICDRKMVYSSIVDWFTQAGDINGDIALERFDETVRSSLRKNVDQTLGKFSISYGYALIASFPRFLMSIDSKVESCTVFFSFATSFELFLLQWPLYVAIILFFCWLAPLRRFTWYGEWIVDLLLSFLIAFVVGEVTDFFTFVNKLESNAARILCFGAELAAVILLFGNFTWTGSILHRCFIREEGQEDSKIQVNQSRLGFIREEGQEDAKIRVNQARLEVELVKP